MLYLLIGNNYILILSALLAQINMSVWKKAAKANQKTHRERHQPESRKHLGLLEKKKDYVKRAQDYNEKQETLRLLRKRALNRNPEEFYHHMINAKVTDGVHHDKDTSDEHTREQIQLMETQDIRYVNLKRTQEMKRIERLQSQLHLIDVNNKPKNKHKYFFDNRHEAEQFKKTQHTQAQHSATVGNYTLEQLSERPLEHIEPDRLAAVTSKRENMYKDLAARIHREKQLAVVQQKLEMKRHLQTKRRCLPPSKVQAATKDTAPLYKWKPQRKR